MARTKQANRKKAATKPSLVAPRKGPNYTAERLNHHAFYLQSMAEEEHEPPDEEAAEQSAEDDDRDWRPEEDEYGDEDEDEDGDEDEDDWQDDAPARGSTRTTRKRAQSRGKAPRSGPKKAKPVGAVQGRKKLISANPKNKLSGCTPVDVIQWPYSIPTGMPLAMARQHVIEFYGTGVV